MTSTPTPRFDAKKDLPAYSAKRGWFDLLTVLPLRFLLVDGAGDPNTSPPTRRRSRPSTLSPTA